MKKIIIVMFLILCQNPIYAECPESVIKAVDNSSLQSKYKKIAYFAYLLKIKREYISKAYLLLSDIRAEERKNFLAFSSLNYGASSTPLLQAGTLESDILAVINKYNLAYLNMLLAEHTEDDLKGLKHGF